jgi:peptidoglycan/xylan/chitin deacetylase (PgdA/CDA1 family)
MADNPAGFSFPSSRIPFDEREGLKVWPNGARMAFLFCNTAEEWQWGVSEVFDPSGMPRFGEKIPSLSMRSSVGYGFEVGIHRIAGLFRDLDLQVTFWTNGNAVEQHRAIIEMLHNDGHEIAAHGYTEGMPMTSLDRAGQADSIKRSVELLSSVTGKTPTTWLGQGASADRDTIELLAEAGFHANADLQDDELPYFVHVGEQTLVVIPYRMIGNLNDVPLMTELGAQYAVADAALHLRETFDVYYEMAEMRPLILNLGTHPHVSGRPDAFKVLKEFMEYVAGHQDVWIPTYAAMAQWWREQFGPLIPEGGGDIHVPAARGIRR